MKATTRPDAIDTIVGSQRLGLEKNATRSSGSSSTGSRPATKNTAAYSSAITRRRRAACSISAGGNEVIEPVCSGPGGVDMRGR